MINYQLININYDRTEQMIFLSVLLSMILMGNIIVIMSLGCSRGRKSRMNFFILHLAVAGRESWYFGIFSLR